MSFFEKIAERKERRDFCSPRFALIKQNVKQCEELLPKIETLLRTLQKVGESLSPQTQQVTIPKYYNEIVKEINALKSKLAEAKQKYIELKEYAEANDLQKKLASKLSKANDSIFQIEHKFETLYSLLLVAVQIIPESKQQIKNEFIKAIRECKISLKTDDPIEVE